MGDTQKLDKYFYGTGDGTSPELIEAGIVTYVPVQCNRDHCTPEERAVIEAVTAEWAAYKAYGGFASKAASDSKPLWGDPKGDSRRSAMKDTSARKLAEIKARVAAGMTLYDLRKECIEYLMMSLQEMPPHLYEARGSDDCQQDNSDAKADTAHAVQHSNLVIRIVNRLKNLGGNFLKGGSNLVL